MKQAEALAVLLATTYKWLFATLHSAMLLFKGPAHYVVAVLRAGMLVSDMVGIRNWLHVA